MEKLKVRSTIKAGWHQVKGSKGGFFAAFVVLSVIELILFGLQQEITTTFTPENWMTPVFFLITLFIVSPLTTGFSMMGLKRARGEPIRSKSAFEYYKRIFNIFGTSLMSVIIVWIGCAVITAVATITLYSIHLFSQVTLTEAYVLFGIAVFIFVFCLFSLTTLLMFSLMILLDTKTSPLRAPFQSIKMAWPHFGRLFLLNVSLAIIFLIGLIPMGFGLIWTLPLIYISLGQAYVRIISLQASLPLTG